VQKRAPPAESEQASYFEALYAAAVFVRLCDGAPLNGAAAATATARVSNLVNAAASSSAGLLIELASPVGWPLLRPQYGLTFFHAAEALAILFARYQCAPVKPSAACLL
jgi:hypothetical protein